MKLVKSFCQGQLREAQAFVVYVRTITRNEFYDFLKARGVRSTEEIVEIEAGTSSIDKETVLVIRSTFSHLPEEQRRAIQAVYLEGRTYEEAAEATGIPLGSLKRYLRLGLSQMRIQLAEVLQGK
jgi:RNA polymerase sigma-70 factor (ECF subfamily)